MGIVSDGRRLNLHLPISMSRPFSFCLYLAFLLDFPGGSDSKESVCNAGDPSWIPGPGRSPGRGHGNPLQYSCQENPHGQRSLVGCSPWGHKELDVTGQLSATQHILYTGASQVVLVVKNLPANAGNRGTGLSPGQKGPLEEGVATYSSILARRIHGQTSLESYSP